MTKNYIAYYRVSTQRQGQSGLGLEAQEKMVQQYIASVGGKLVDSRTEVESGKNNQRPKLAEALAIAKSRKNPCVLIVAKLDRLARSNSFVNKVMDSGIEFVACDFPGANRFLLQIMSAVAEYEAKLISDRTVAALEAVKERGQRLGNPAFKVGVVSPQAAVNRDEAVAKAELLRPVVDSLRNSGITTVRDIATELNQRGYRTVTGGLYHPTTVQRLLQRLYPSTVAEVTESAIEPVIA